MVSDVKTQKFVSRGYLDIYGLSIKAVGIDCGLKFPRHYFSEFGESDKSLKHELGSI